MPSKGGQEQEVKVDRKRQSAIKDSIKEAEKIFGVRAVMQLGDTPPLKVDSFSTGSISLDLVLGCGGLPRSYMTEIFGPEGGGKSTLCLQAVASANRQGMSALYIDTENKLNLKYAAALGVDIRTLLVAQPEYGEAAMQIAEIFIRNEAVSLVVVDSVAMLVPKSEFEGEIGDQGVGQLPRMLTQALRKIKDIVRKSNVAMVFINQIRDKIGVTYGSTETTPGGHAVKHNCSVRVDIRRISALKRGDDIIGARTRAKVVKNTFAAPFQECEYDLIYGEGIAKEAELLDLASGSGVLKKDGADYTYNGEKMGYGRERARLFLRSNPDIFQKIYLQYMESKK